MATAAEFLIRLQAIADMGDAREAAAELRKLGEEAIDTGKDFEKMGDSAKEAGEQAAGVGTGAGAGATGAKKLGEEAAAAAPKTRNMAAGALEASRAFEDLQYGIRGVLNNLPVMIMSFGGGAGLAAGISFAAVAGDLLFRTLRDGKGDMDGAKKAADALADGYAKLAEKQKEIGRAQGEMIANAFVERLNAETRALDEQARAADRALQFQVELAALKREQAAADRAVAEAGIDARLRVDPTFTRAQAEAERAALRAAADEAAIAERIEAENHRITVARKAAADASAESEQAARREAEITGRLAQVKAELAKAQEQLGERARLELQAATARAELERIRNEAPFTSSGPQVPRMEAAAARARDAEQRAAAIDPAAVGRQVENLSAQLDNATGELKAAQQQATIARERAAATEQAAQTVVAEFEIQARSIAGIGQTLAEARGVKDAQAIAAAAEADAKAAVEALKAQAEASAGGIAATSAEFRAGLAAVEKALADGLQLPEQAGVIAALNNLKASLDARDAAVRQAIEQTIQRVRENADAIRALEANLRR